MATYIRWLVVLTGLFRVGEGNEFTFYGEPTDVVFYVDVPLNYSSVYGKLEPSDSDWFILFQVDHGLIPSTFVGINEDIQAGGEFSQCARYSAIREIKLTAELHPWFVRIKSKNVERYEHPDKVELGRSFSVTFYVQDEEDGPLCSLPFQLKVLGGPVTAVTQNPISVKSSTFRSSSRRTIAYNAPAVSTKRYQSNLRFATFKMQKPKTTTEASAQKQTSYIDIQNDRQVYEMVQRSKTKEINSVWSITFLLFLWLEVGIIGSFVVFGLVMLVVLQIKPNGYNEKFIALTD
ncbi:unnamed protein product [Bursaphelenchus okinawaensis]|uniref:Uncharacterized protein n=1 Tax=Bursaphelenchus okinawaensis TaxID=465554 RepID=A0A811K382_9BILA|nr:unnamed protein product [Bursaphelenchus okinawaensis]CAG9090751.1 unnamed protein product [Bursaphelenchus okinawaensis]